MRPAYEEPIYQINKQQDRTIKTKPGWRDYITRQRIGAVICLAGLTLATFSGRTFANSFIEVLEDFGETISSARESAFNINEDTIEQKAQKVTTALETSAENAIYGVVVAGVGYAIARLRPKEQWSPKIPRYEKVTRKQHKTL
ncbi:MAG: hypothetical protein KKD18_02540 [Nanoarchaeota archaeon]|nr:hypothetical protein [Nanoarchaeota archaeon]MBU0977269.1 hypothetical protein [Nanoarchaeota archaeon]